MVNRLKQQLNFIIEADKMKSVMRQTLLADKSREESDAEHSWHIALMALTLLEHAGFEGIDINRVVKMAIIHDLVEIYAGDTFAYDTVNNESKEEREKEAADKLFGLLPPEQGEEYRGLWEEFDEMETPDAMYAAAIDRLQPFINNTLTDGHTWVKHSVTAEQIYKRMAPVKKALPALWGFIEEAVESGIKKGWVKK